MSDLSVYRHQNLVAAANDMGYAAARACYERRSLAPLNALVAEQRRNPMASHAVQSVIFSFSHHLHRMEKDGAIKLNGRRPAAAADLEFYFYAGDSARISAESQVIIDLMRSLFSQPVAIVVNDAPDGRGFRVRVTPNGVA